MKSTLKIQESKVSKTLEDAYKEFRLYCIIKNLSDITIRGYDQSFRRFTEFFPKQKPLNELNKEAVDAYISILRNMDNLKQVSIASMIRELRVILYYFMSMKYINEFSIQTGKAEKVVKETYTDSELGILLRKPDFKKCDFAEYRTWVLINYFMATGNRVSTVLNIKIKDLDLSNGFITLTKTKNRKQQIIPLSHTIIQILIEYLAFRKGQPDDYLFCNSCGEKTNINGISASVRRYNLRRGVTKTSLHLFRHTFAKKWILAGGDIFRLQKILGHSSLEMVKEYVNMFSDDLKRDFDAFNPLEQMFENRGRIKI